MAIQGQLAPLLMQKVSGDVVTVSCQGLSPVSPPPAILVPASSQLAGALSPVNHKGLNQG